MWNLTFLIKQAGNNWKQKLLATELSFVGSDRFVRFYSSEFCQKWTTTRRSIKWDRLRLNHQERVPLEWAKSSQLAEQKYKKNENLFWELSDNDFLSSNRRRTPKWCSESSSLGGPWPTSTGEFLAFKLPSFARYCYCAKDWASNQEFCPDQVEQPRRQLRVVHCLYSTNDPPY